MDSFIRENLVVKRQSPGNPHDRFTIAGIRDGDIVGHLPAKKYTSFYNMTVMLDSVKSPERGAT